jgi:hypothetical protein
MGLKNALAITRVTRLSTRIPSRFVVHCLAAWILGASARPAESVLIYFVVYLTMLKLNHLGLT